MAKYNPGQLTEKGIALNAKVQAGLCNINITKAASGAGDYGEGESILNRTELKDKKQEFGITFLRVRNQSTAVARIDITNHKEDGSIPDLQETYLIKEIGLYATDPDEGEILYAMATAVKDMWDPMPAYDGQYPTTATVDFITAVANASTVTVNFSSPEGLDDHIEMEVSTSEGVHGFRVDPLTDDLYYKKDGQWVKTGGGDVPPDLIQRLEALEAANTALNGRVTTIEANMADYEKRLAEYLEAMKKMEEQIGTAQSSILGIALAVQLYTGANILDMDNVVAESFDNIDGIIIHRGVYDQPNRRIYA